MAKVAKSQTLKRWTVILLFLIGAGGIVLGYEFANSLASLEKYLKYWAIFALVVAVSVIMVLKNKLEKLIEG